MLTAFAIIHANPAIDAEVIDAEVVLIKEFPSATPWSEARRVMTRLVSQMGRAVVGLDTVTVERNSRAHHDLLETLGSQCSEVPYYGFTDRVEREGG